MSRLMLTMSSRAHNVASHAHNVASLAHNVASLAHNVVSQAHNVASQAHNVASLAHNVASCSQCRFLLTMSSRLAKNIFGETRRDEIVSAKLNVCTL